MRVVSCLLMFCLSPGHTQPVSCIEDMQCSVGYFCEAPSHTCRECVRCQDYKREASAVPNTCTTSADSCGPCFEGLVFFYGYNFKGKCVPSESLQHLYFYGYLIAAMITLLIVVLFVYELHHTDVFKVSYYNYSTAVSQLNEKPVMGTRCGVTYALNFMESLWNLLINILNNKYLNGQLACK